MRILVVGAGAVGGYFGALWCAAGRDVTLLARTERYERLKATGLTVLGERPDIRVFPNVITADQIQAPFDVIFLAVTAQALDAAIRDMAPAVSDRTAIVPALNGVRHFERLRSEFGDVIPLASVVKCATSLDEKGVIKELAPFAQIAIGSWVAGQQDRLAAVQSALLVDRVDVQLSSCILEEVGEKWLMMAALGAANTLLGGDIGSINADPRGAWVIQQILIEVRQALEQTGTPFRADTVAALAKAFADPASHQTSSMYRNMLAGKPVEYDAILGDLLDRVSDHRCYPLLSAAYTRLVIYAASRQA